LIPNYCEKDIDQVAKRLATRRFVLDVEKFTNLESVRKQLQASTEELQAKRNQLAKSIGMKKAKGEDASLELSSSQQVNEELKISSERLDALQIEIQQFVMGIPNLPHESVPVGKDESGNVEISRMGASTKFLFPH
jgi:seryl-tRNA synthetase